MIRFAAYDIRLFERDGRTVMTVIIYSSDVKQVATSLDIGSLTYTPGRVMMNEYDGNTIYEELATKVHAGRDLTDADQLNLIFLPLMRNTLPKDELVVKSINLAQVIPDTAKRNACIAAAFAFANRYLNENEVKKLLEVLKMTDLAAILVEDAVKDKTIEIAKNLLNLKMPIDTIVTAKGLSSDTIKRLKMELNKE